jgi:HK97 family phage portal protein
VEDQLKVFGMQIGPRFHSIKPVDQKTSLTWKVTRLLYSGQDAIWMPRDYAAFAKQGYQACVDVFACIDLIAKAISGIPLVLYSKPKSKNEKRKEIESHPLLDLLRRPNEQQGGSALLDAAIRYYLIAGNSYLETVTVDGLPRELHSLRPDRMTVLVGDLKHRIAGYRYKTGSDKQDFINQEVLHLKAFHPTDDFYGLSPIEIAANQIDTSNAGVKLNAKLLQNDLRPSGLFTFEREMTPEQKKEFKESVKDSYLDVDARGLPLVIDGKADYKQLSVTSKDADFTNLDKT